MSLARHERGAAAPKAHADFSHYTDGERRADALVHAAGVSAGLAAACVLGLAVLPSLAAVPAASVALYAASLIAVFAASAAYNLVGHARWKAALRRLDHASIFILIAGTYTPFGTRAIGRDADSYILLAIVWVLALIGVALKLGLTRRFDRTALVLYLLQGWAVVAAPGALLAALPVPALVLLVAGGVLYTAGVEFHLWRRLPYHNAIWHAFVLAAAACHFAAVMATFAPA
ncbi:MAG: hemolysin III family protein [Alphaproteobacteria bacterium]|nr:hemolysin III family protein [Alphaproteobacteria bacterium]